MFLGNIFRKYKEREHRLLLVKEIIDWLQIDSKQKILYLESLEFLDDEGLDRFYKKLISVIDIIEENENMENFQKQKSSIKNIEVEETIEKKQEINSFNLILDNI